jgi:diguanylate cyclase (GGDEF)-like protein/PAS domain S-box-containing protein
MTTDDASSSQLPNSPKRDHGVARYGGDVINSANYMERAKEIAGLGVYTIDLDRRVISMSREMLLMLRTDLDAPDMPLDEYRRRFYHPDDLAPGVASAEAAYHDSDDLWLTSRVVAGDGDTIWIQTRSSVEQHDDGTRFVLGVVQDVTEQVRSAERSRLLATLVESTEDAILTTDLDGVVTSWNAGAERLYLYSAAEVIGRNMADIIAPNPAAKAEENAALANRLSVIASNQSIRHLVLERQRKDGSKFIMSASASPLSDDQGRVVGSVLIGRDVTELEEAHDQLRASEERFRALVQHGSDIIGLIDPDGTLAYVSPSLSAITGRDPQEAMGRPFTEFAHPEDLGEVQSLFEILVRNPGSTIDLTYRIVHKDGGVRHIQAIATNLVNVSEVGGIVFNARDVSEAIEHREQLAHHALHDPLTGLANRILLIDRVGQALRRTDGGSGAIFLLDIDHFQAINDAFGYPTGDEVLVSLADRLTYRAHETDTVARLGGDRFAIWCEYTTEESVQDFAQRIVQAVGEPITVGTRDLSITASVGVAHDAGERSRSAEEILRDVNIATLRAKENGRGRFELFDETMSRNSKSRLELRSELLIALEEGNLVVYYQPEIGFASGSTVGAEALVRWQHPERGLVPPMEFIPAAEESDLILSMGRWILETACRDAAAWPETGGPAVISVNLSARQFRDPELEEHIAHALRSSGLPASRLCLEITETLLMTDVDRTAKLLENVKSTGVLTAVDDFGTGYSSLAYLTQFPVDFLKIDRAFVEGLDKATDKRGKVVAAVIGLAERLGIKTIAEGVETEAQAAALRVLGCDIAQGFLFARPMPHNEFVVRLGLNNDE